MKTSTWENLSSEDKIQLANIFLKKKEVKFSGCYGEVERANVVSVDRFENGKFFLSVDDDLYKKCVFEESQIKEMCIEYINS